MKRILFALIILGISFFVHPLTYADDVCGDSIISSGESCDDGNTSNGDGCNSNCRLEVSDLGVYTSRLDTYTNSGSVFGYKIYYFNNGTTSENNVQIRTQLSPDLTLVTTDVSYSNSTPTPTSFGTPDDPCYVQLLNETGPYMDVLEAFAISMGAPDLLTLMYDTNNYVGDIFNQAPYNQQEDMIGEAFNEFVKRFGGNDYLLGFVSLGIDITNIPGCGSDETTTYTRDIGTLGSKVGGSINLFVQNKGTNIPQSETIGTFNDEINTFSLPQDTNTLNSPISFSLTNTSETSKSSLFFNKHGGPLLLSNDTILDSIVQEGMSDKEIVVAARQLVRDYTYNNPILIEHERDQSWETNTDSSNPVHMLNSLYGMCGEINGVMASVLELLGFPTRIVGMSRHTIMEVYLSGARAMLDADGGVYWDDPIDGHIYSIQELADNPEIIYNNPQGNAYLTNNYVDMISDIEGHDLRNADTSFPDTYTMNFDLFPQDTITYTYSYVQDRKDNNGQRNNGDVTVVRKLTPLHNIQQSENEFSYTEELPYLIKTTDISASDTLEEDVDVYISIGDQEEEYLGSLTHRVGDIINKSGRTNNYYSYTLRFVCREVCDVSSLLEKITITNEAIFNPLTMPYTGTLDMYIQNYASFENGNLQASVSYDKERTPTTTNISNDEEELNMSNNTHLLSFTTTDTSSVILPQNNTFTKTVLTNKGYQENNIHSLFSGEDEFLGQETLDFHNTSMIGENIIITSLDKYIQAYLPQGTTITPSGDTCTAQTLVAPEDITDDYPDTTKTFKIGSPCPGTTLNFSQDIHIRIYLPEGFGDTTTVNISSNGSDWEIITGTIIDEHTIDIVTDHFSYFSIYTNPITSSNTGDSSPTIGGGGIPLQKDICTGEDLSDSFYDGICENTHGTPIVINSGCTEYTEELNEAYQFAFDNNITTYASCSNANLTGFVSRSHMAKMISNFAIHIMKKTPDVNKECKFTDIDNQPIELQNYIQTACQLGLMGLNTDGSVATTFLPAGTIDRAQFGTILSRLLRNETYNNGQPYYKKHLNALQKEGIMTKIDTPSAKELRGWVMLMMQRIANK